MGLLAVVFSLAATGSLNEPQQISPLDAARQATVLIEVVGPRGKVTGSGFVVAADGTVATAAHVIRGGWVASVRFATGLVAAVRGVRELDQELDLALLDVPPAGITPVRLGDSDSVWVGQRLLAIGSPLGLQGTVTDGVLSASPGGQRQALQISIPVSPGSSGGPVITEQGEVVAMVVRGMRARGAENLNFALPINAVRSRLPAALARASQPLDQAAAPLASGVSLASLSESSPLVGAAVNGNLKVDYARTRGIEVRSDWKRKDGVDVSSLLLVGTSFATTGEMIVEREHTVTLRLGETLGTEVHRTIFTAGRTNRFLSQVRYRPTDDRTKGFASMVDVRGNDFVMANDVGGTWGGHVPDGTLPASFADVVLAAWVGDLPDQLEFVVLDPQHDRLLPVRYTFHERARRKIPIVKPGTSCDTRQVKPVTMEVVLGIREVGLERQPVAVLAHGSHVIVDDIVTCVRLQEVPPGRVVAMK
ncbi:MAG: serine protease [Gemmatimonadota bacterium]